MSRLTLKEQLAQLNDAPAKTADPEGAYTSLDPLDLTRVGDEGREHYLDVGPSTLRRVADQTLLGEKYEGKRVGRMKIFDDDEEEEEEDEEQQGSEGDDLDGSDEEEEDDLDEDDEEDEDEEEDDEGGEDEDDEDGDEKDEEIPTKPSHAGPSTTRSLDPLGSLRQARQKDIERGRGIRRQKALFDTLLTLRITFQKALTASAELQPPFPADPAGELESRRQTTLNSLANLSEELLELRTALVLPGTEVPSLGKRKRGDGEVTEEYLLDAAKDSFALVDAQRAPMVGILNKWSSKINAASLAVNNSKAAGSSKFFQGTKGQMGIIEAIEAGIASRAESGKTFMESEEATYRSLLKEVIESRSGGANGGADLSHLRREKKKKREAERGGSKGRKLRYTVHEKAQNFLVPIPLRNGWSDEQMDELFSSLLGGAGMKGGNSEGVVSAGGLINGDEGLASLGGLRVF